jgi:hypothetical protein
MNSARERLCATSAKTQALSGVFLDTLAATENDLVELEQIDIYAK